MKKTKQGMIPTVWHGVCKVCRAEFEAEDYERDRNTTLNDSTRGLYWVAKCEECGSCDSVMFKPPVTGLTGLKP